MVVDSKSLANSAKERGNAHFAKNTREGYELALVAYREAIALDPEDYVFYSNCSACYIELGKNTWEPIKQVESFARALMSARDCTGRSPHWAKGFVRQSAAEFELMAAIARWTDRKKLYERWRREDEQQAERDRKEGREPRHTEKREEVELEIELKSIVENASYSSCESSCRKGLKLEPSNGILRTRLQALRDAGHLTDEMQDRNMRDTKLASDMKVLGNADFAAKKWKAAALNYTKALEYDPFDHVFYSNRSACYAESEEFEKALMDAEKCVAFCPSFAKGYSRLALALFHVGRYADMEAAAKQGLGLDSSSSVLRELYKQAQVETREAPEVQAQMHRLRQEKRRDVKFEHLMRGLNAQGNGVQILNPGNASGSGSKASLTEEQMREMARALSRELASRAGCSQSGEESHSPSPTSDSTESARPASIASKL